MKLSMSFSLDGAGGTEGERGQYVRREDGNTRAEREVKRAR